LESHISKNQKKIRSQPKVVASHVFQSTNQMAESVSHDDYVEM
jgi:hypothetical protein